jgi:hypothetical protein
VSRWAADLPSFSGATGRAVSRALGATASIAWHQRPSGTTVHGRGVDISSSAVSTSGKVSLGGATLDGNLTVDDRRNFLGRRDDGGVRGGRAREEAVDSVGGCGEGLVGGALGLVFDGLCGALLRPARALRRLGPARRARLRRLVVG